jgi:hypothetical protein
MKGKEMKRFIAIAFLIFIAGCTTIEYDKEAGTVTYSRLGGTEFDKLEIVRQDNGDLLLEIHKYNSEGASEIVGAAVKAAVEAAR